MDVGQDNPGSDSRLLLAQKGGSSEKHPGRHGWSQLTFDGFKELREQSLQLGKRAGHPAVYPLDPSQLTGDGPYEGWSLQGDR